MNQLRYQTRKNYQQIFFLSFIGFGLLLIFSTTLMEFLQHRAMFHDQLLFKARGFTQKNRKAIEESIGKTKEISRWLTENRIFHFYLSAPSESHKVSLANQFQIALGAQQSISGIRYINKDGLEKIIVRSKKNSLFPGNEPEDRLTEVSHTDYFKTALHLPPDKSYIAPMQPGAITEPDNGNPTPGLLIATPIWKLGRVHGILVIETSLTYLTREANDSFEFNISIVDNMGRYLLNNTTDRHNTGDPTPINTSDLRQYRQYILSNNEKTDGTFFILNFSPEFPEPLDLKLIFKTKHTLQREESKSFYYTFNLEALLLILVCIPLAYYLSKIPYRLQSSLERIINKYYDEKKVIDNFIPITHTDKYGRIKEVNEAFCSMMLYQAEELIGKKHSMLKHPDTPPSIYSDLWQTISSGKVWKGELINRKKDGNIVWVRLVIVPESDKNGYITGYTAIYENTTERKEIEYFTITDHITGLYTRTKLENDLPKEIERTQKIRQHLSILIVENDNVVERLKGKLSAEADQLMAKTGEFLRKNLESGAIAGRWSPSQVAILLPGKNLQAATDIARNLRDKAVNLSEDSSEKTTLTIGIAQYQSFEPLKAFYQRAEKSLEQAIANGRDTEAIYRQ